MSTNPGATLGTDTRGRGQKFGTQKYVTSEGAIPSERASGRWNPGATLGTVTRGRGQKVRTQNTCPPRGGYTLPRGHQAEGGKPRRTEPSASQGQNLGGLGLRPKDCPGGLVRSSQVALSPIPSPTQPGGVHHSCAPTTPPQPTCTVPPWACPCAVGERRRWVGGRVGGWEVGRQHGERGGNQLWHHTTAFAPNVPHLPHPGGVSELIRGDRPVYFGPRSRSTWLWS